MAKKTLNEGTVRRFMKLANIGTLTENYFENNSMFEEEEEEAPVEDPAAMEDPAAAEDPMAAEADPAAEVGGDGEAAAKEVPPEAVAAIVDAIAGAVSDVTGTPVEGGEDAAAAEAPVDDVPVDEPVGDEVPVEEEPPLEEVEQALAAANVSLELTEDELVAEVARRVAKRLVREPRRK